MRRAASSDTPYSILSTPTPTPNYCYLKSTLLYFTLLPTLHSLPQLLLRIAPTSILPFFALLHSPRLDPTLPLTLVCATLLYPEGPSTQCLGALVPNAAALRVWFSGTWTLWVPVLDPTSSRAHEDEANVVRSQLPIHIYTTLCVCVYICIHMHIGTHIDVCMYICIRVYIYVHVSIDNILHRSYVYRNI